MSRETFDIIYGRVPFEENTNIKKRRPVLLLASFDDKVRAFKITSSIDGMSDAVMSRHYIIRDIDDVGLVRPSGVDLGRVIVKTNTHLGTISKMTLY